MKNFICMLLLAILGSVETAIAQGNDSLTVDAGMKAGNVKEMGKNISKDMADSAYISTDFAAAILYYEELLAENGESAEVYYNLGNSYYKSDNIAKAILNYERALLIEPDDDDIRFNLEMAYSKTVDKVVPQSELFFATWVKQIRNLNNADGWGRWGISFFLLFICSALIYIFGKVIVYRKVGFIVGIFSLLLIVIANLFAFQQKKELTERKGAIVVSPSITVKSTPTDGGTELFILHEGHKVRIKDDSMKGWKEIVLEDGNVGWIPTSAIELI